MSVISLKAFLETRKNNIPRLEAEILLAHVLKKPRSYLYSHPEKILSSQQLQLIKHYLQRRIDGEPIAYILGEKEFWSLSLEVNKHTLIPRPDTELLVEQVLKIIPANMKKTIVDLGTGSGAVALALARECPNCLIVATDLSAEALQIAKRNAKRLGLNNIEFYQGEWCAALPPTLYDIILSNPPYIPENDPHLLQGDLRFEPQQALVAGKDGLNALRSIVPQAKNFLQAGGYLFFEHGYDQGEAVRKLLLQHEFTDIVTAKDWAGHDRVTFGKNS